MIGPFGPDADTSGLLPFIETIATCARERDHDILPVTRDEGSAGPAPIWTSSGPAGWPWTTWRPPGTTGSPCSAIRGPTVAREVNFVGRFRRGATAAAAGHGLPCTVVDQPQRGPHGVSAALDEVLGSGDHSIDGRLGLVVHDTEAVQPVLTAVTGRGHLPGRDLSVAGLCPEAPAAGTTPPVTDVSLEPRDVSRRAMRTLFRLLDGDSSAARPVELITPRLARRRTTLPG
ncbi:substrate-binding domain-containing protein [Actinoplanes sp. NPDC004185]